MMDRSKIFRCSLVVLMPLAMSQLAADRIAEARGLAVVVHLSSPVENLSHVELRKILLGETRQWPDHRKIVLVERDAESDVYRQMVHVVLHMTPMDYKRHLLALEFKGVELPLIKTLNSDDGAIKFVRNVPGAIALVETAPAAEAAARVKILRIDGKLLGEAGYPLQ